jgi:hypothetical protein
MSAESANARITPVSNTGEQTDMVIDAVAVDWSAALQMNCPDYRQRGRYQF